MQPNCTVHIQATNFHFTELIHQAFGEVYMAKEAKSWTLVIFIVSKHQVERVEGKSVSITVLCYLNVSYKQKFRRNMVMV